MCVRVKLGLKPPPVLSLGSRLAKSKLQELIHSKYMQTLAHLPAIIQTSSASSKLTQGMTIERKYITDVSSSALKKGERMVHY